MITTWFLLAGALLILMALLGSAMDKLPLSPGLIYLLIGVALGPGGFGVIAVDPLHNVGEFRFICEVVVLVSLFTVGLKLRVSWSDPLWHIPFRLATISMAVVIATVAVAGVYGLGLSLGGALLLGAILAPTDPVLASDVQVRHADDRDRARFALTAEGGLNDGIAFPFVILGLGLLGVGEMGPTGLYWLTVDVVWAVGAGLAVGWLCGGVVGRLVLYVRRVFKEALGWEEFLTLGLIALSYGVALLIHAYGFLAVLAAGLALRRIETDTARERIAPAMLPKSDEKTHPATAPAHMVRSLLGFTEKLERIGELVVVLALGVILSTIGLDKAGVWLALLMFVVIRPLSVFIGLAWARCPLTEKRLMAWFGIRGVGSLYYLFYSLQAGAPGKLMETLVPLVVTVVAASIAVHGVSATPLMASARPRSRTKQRGRR
ncbi:MAG: cation:proton antiporter [Burkholderiales bacterium]